MVMYLADHRERLQQGLQPNVLTSGSIIRTQAAAGCQAGPCSSSASVVKYFKKRILCVWAWPSRPACWMHAGSSARVPMGQTGAVATPRLVTRTGLRASRKVAGLGSARSGHSPLGRACWSHAGSGAACPWGRRVFRVLGAEPFGRACRCMPGQVPRAQGADACTSRSFWVQAFGSSGRRSALGKRVRPRTRAR